jgi:hypothetical protein
MVNLEFTDRSGTQQDTPVDGQGRFLLKGFEGYRYRVQAYSVNNQNLMHAEPIEVLVDKKNAPVRLIITKSGRPPRFNQDKKSRKP